MPQQPTARPSLPLAALLAVALALGGRPAAPLPPDPQAGGKGDGTAGKEGEGAQAPAEEAEGGASAEMPVYGETLQVTATRTEQAVEDAPVSITVIGRERLESQPEASWGEVLRGVPGLNVVQFSARDFNFTSRGATSSLATSQLALLDGRSIYQDFYGFVMWDVLPISLDEVAQIEVLRGPGSAIWGANALSGVINVRTRSPRESAGGAAMLGGGEQGTLQASARWAEAGERWSWKLSGSYYTQDAWERDDRLPSGLPFPASARFENDGTEQPKLDARVDYEPGGDRRWSLSGGTAFTTGLMHTGIGPFSIDSGTNMSYGKVSYAAGGLEATAYVNRLDGDARNLINGIDFAFRTDTYTGEATWRRALGERQVLLVGGNLRANRFDLSIAPRDDSRNELGLFVEDQVRLAERLDLNVGGRLDWFDTIGATFSPRTSLIVKPRPGHALRFAYNRAYRSPSLVNNFLDTAVPNVIALPPAGAPFVFVTRAVGNEELDEEKVDAFEIGYTVTLRERATLTAAVYRNRTVDTIDFTPSRFYSPADPPPGWPLPPQLVPPGTLPAEFSYRNIGEVVDQGLELSADVALSRRLGANVSYTFQDEPEITDDDPTAPLVVNVPPRHQWALGLTLSGGPVFGSVGATFTGEAFWSDVLDQRFWGDTRSFTLVNATLGARLAGDRYSLALKGTNLTDERAKQHVFGDIVRRKVTAELRARF